MRIAVLEDDAGFADCVAGWLRDAAHDVHLFSQSRLLMNVAGRESFDLFLLDWALPDISGTDFLRWLRLERHDETPVVMLSVRDSEDDIVEALTCGADDYVVKPVNRRVLIARIQALLRRKTIPDGVRSMAMPPYYVDFGSKRITVEGLTVPLTEKEFDLALFLFRNVGRQISRHHLLETVWGRNPNVATRTVDTHISRVRNKLNLRPENGFRIVPTYNFGYRLERVEMSADDVGDPTVQQ